MGRGVSSLQTRFNARMWGREEGEGLKCILSGMRGGEVLRYIRGEIP